MAKKVVIMRIQKRLENILVSYSTEKLFQLLSTLKKIIDDKISANYASQLKLKLL